LITNYDKTDKILFYLNSNFINFGIAKFLKENYNCELYAIVDCNKNLKKFFESQKLVHFEKIWYYREYVNNSDTEFNIKFLKEFENKYKLNLWQILYADRFFYKYNEYYNFNYHELLTILSNESKLFESILDEVKPDFIVIKGTDQQQNDLFQKLCLARNIPVLTLFSTRFGSRSMISKGFEVLDENVLKTPEKDFKSLEDLQNFIRRYSKQVSKRLSKKGKPSSGLPTFSKRIKIASKYISLVRNNQDFIAFKGRTLGKIIVKNILFFFQTPYRRTFLERYSKKIIDTNIPYVYFPLHLEPERILSITAPYYDNQLEVITTIAKSIPIDHKLYVKDHPAMQEFGYRSTSYYKKILKLPNVVLISSSIPNEQLIKTSNLIITIAGTTGLEAAFFGKPVIVLSDVIYSDLPNIIRLKNIEELPETIHDALTRTASMSDLNRFVNLIHQNSFDFDLIELLDDSFADLWYEGVLDVDLSEEKMNQHLTKNKIKYEKLVAEHIKKIQYYKKTRFEKK